jgi:hypothetical protein
MEHISSILLMTMQEWQVYITIANVSSKIRHIPSMQSLVTVSLMLIPFKSHNIAQKALDEQP